MSVYFCLWFVGTRICRKTLRFLEKIRRKGKQNTSRVNILLELQESNENNESNEIADSVGVVDIFVALYFYFSSFFLIYTVRWVVRYVRSDFQEKFKDENIVFINNFVR